MAEIVNLRHSRKQRARAKAAEAAAENRARHGRTAAEKLRDAEEARRRERTLDQARKDEHS